MNADFDDPEDDPGEEEWDPGGVQKHCLMVDCNNQYGWAMMQFLPLSDFRWLNNNELSMFTETFIKRALKRALEKGHFISKLAIKWLTSKLLGRGKTMS